MFEDDIYTDVNGRAEMELLSPLDAAFFLSLDGSHGRGIGKSIRGNPLLHGLPPLNTKIDHDTKTLTIVLPKSVNRLCITNECDEDIEAGVVVVAGPVMERWIVDEAWEPRRSLLLHSNDLKRSFCVPLLSDPMRGVVSHTLEDYDVWVEYRRKGGGQRRISGIAPGQQTGYVLRLVLDCDY
jgi:hypothetical protein